MLSLGLLHPGAVYAGRQRAHDRHDDTTYQWLVELHVRTIDETGVVTGEIRSQRDPQAPGFLDELSEVCPYTCQPIVTPLAYYYVLYWDCC